MKYDDFFDWGDGMTEVFRRDVEAAGDPLLSRHEILLGRCKDAETKIAVLERDLATAQTRVTVLTEALTQTRRGFSTIGRHSLQEDITEIADELEVLVRNVLTTARVKA